VTAHRTLLAVVLITLLPACKVSIGDLLLGGDEDDLPRKDIPDDDDESEGEGETGNEGEGETGSCDFSPDPNDADGEPGAMTGMTEAHNFWRFRVGIPPLSWSASVASSAQAWADHLTHDCLFEHSGSSNGENLYATSETAVVEAEESVLAWASEREFYDFGTEVSGSNFSSFGHYTQVVWEDSTQVGCAVSINPSCGFGQVWVCQYAPPGNFIGQAPYGDTEDPCVDLDNDDVIQRDDADDHDRFDQ